MKTARKSLLVALCAILLVVASVMGTLAYLTSTTEVVKNTFTVGNVKITLDELDVDNSTEGENDRDIANEYHLIPGSTYTKDPTVHMDADSEDAWLFVKVENGIVDIEGDNTIAAQMAANGWALVAGETNIYAYKEIATAEVKDYVVFETIEISGTADLTGMDEAVVNVTAYAVQAENFDTAADAWAATFGA